MNRKKGFRVHKRVYDLDTSLSLQERINTLKQTSIREVRKEIKVFEAVIDVPQKVVLEIVRKHFETDASLQESGFTLEKIEPDYDGDAIDLRVTFVHAGFTIRGNEKIANAADDDDDDDDS